MTTAPEFALDPQQVRFFDSFGFLKVPGVFAADVDAISAAFDAVFAAEDTPYFLPPENEFHVTDDPEYAQRLRQIIPGFLDKSPELARLKDDPRIVGTVRSLIGDHFVYSESDGNIFNCDVLWHTDMYGADVTKENIKFFFYLEPLDADSGALRVLPGTHHQDDGFGPRLRGDLWTPAKATENYGMPLDQLPAHTIDVVPGDMVIINFRVLHGSWNGPPGRRLFTINYTQAA